MNNKGFFAIGTIYMIFVLILLVVSVMVYVAITYKDNNNYVIEKVNETLNRTDTNWTDAFQNIVNYTK
ncbi:MAG: hypothetical protein IJO32_06380 [Bacilli bacterium]|nr:hypothetical protein [Bacilli bacterium]